MTVHSYFEDNGMPSSFQFAHTSSLNLKKKNTIPLKIFYTTLLKYKIWVVFPLIIEKFVVDKKNPA